MIYQIVSVADVEQDLILAIDWYNSQQHGLAERFLNEYDNVINKLKENPFIYQKYNHHIRKVKLKSFPYMIFYMVNSDKVIILAVFHGAKNPLNIMKNLDDRYDG